MEGLPNRPRIVIAEDFVLIQESIRLALEKDCDIVALVEDGEAAVDAVATLAPDILLLDVSLPKLRGFSVVEKLTRADSATKVIFVTSYSDKNYVERAFEIGAKGYVLKGTLQTELLAAVREVIRGGLYRSPLLR
jgi:DNA-binding NarL/FixJ family response regulator